MLVLEQVLLLLALLLFVTRPLHALRPLLHLRGHTSMHMLLHMHTAALDCEPVALLRLASPPCPGRAQARARANLQQLLCLHATIPQLLKHPIPHPRRCSSAAEAAAFARCRRRSFAVRP